MCPLFPKFDGITTSGFVTKLECQNQLTSLYDIRYSTTNPIMTLPCPLLSKENKKVVRFSTVEIRVYETSISPNPSCSQGPGLELGWAYLCLETTSVDDYEEKYPSKHRRNSANMLISLDMRELILKEVGYSRREIEECVRMKHTRMPNKKTHRARCLPKQFSSIFRTISRPNTKYQLRNSSA